MYGQYLLLLAAPGTIATVTWLSHKPESSYYHERALHIPVNHDEAEEIVAHAPDLILAGFYSARTTVFRDRTLRYSHLRAGGRENLTELADFTSLQVNAPI